MKIKPNTYYKLRNGRKAYIWGRSINYNPNNYNNKYFCWLGQIYGKNLEIPGISYIEFWSLHGSYDVHDINGKDIISEWTDLDMAEEEEDKDEEELEDEDDLNIAEENPNLKQDNTWATRGYNFTYRDYNVTFTNVFYEGAYEVITIKVISRHGNMEEARLKLLGRLKSQEDDALNQAIQHCIDKLNGDIDE